MAALIATGITSEGQREIPGLTLGDSENEASWDDVLRDLTHRGLSGVDRIVSDVHKRLKIAWKHCQGVRWQRCHVHFLRNIPSHAPASQRGPLAQALYRLFRPEMMEEARPVRNEILRIFGEKAPEAIECPEEGGDETLNMLTFPQGVPHPTSKHPFPGAAQ
ncbi:transposase for insertion sequence element ISRM5 [Leptospirillum ferriphilum ML-04]|uniref:Mutator family transposase n=1 Tax=Leptospirillum ferriphilum (strain ML-04) TaxID=1048260 RepID=J9Z714_LEPFM|nr:IS256 family transposase [Leptospirillum ferriphilum]AFS52275.1 transposase for insertion sequence element ISRM5 [Leptospirillum ferriphilum ML-04]